MPRNYTLPVSSILLSFFVFLSCEEPIELDLDDKARLVVISNFSDQNGLEVVVSKTNSVLTSNDIEYVTDASVMVFSDGELLEILELVPANAIKGTPPFYHTTTLRPEVGKIYEIKVNAPGFEPVTATNSIPQAVPIETVEFSNTVGNGTGNDTKVIFNVSITIQDPVAFRNFYHLIFYPELYGFSQGPDLDTIVYLPKVEAHSANPNLPVIKHFDNRSFLMTDVSFNGTKIELQFTGSYSFDKDLFVPGNFRIELRSVSEEYFLYHSTLTRQINSSKNPVSDGVVVYDDIENGEGIFAGYSSSYDEFKIQN